MKQKIVIEVDEKLRDGELLVYKDGIVKSVEIHMLLPELKKIQKNEEKINELENQCKELVQLVKELRGED